MKTYVCRMSQDGRGNSRNVRGFLATAGLITRPPNPGKFHSFLPEQGVISHNVIFFTNLVM